MSRGFIEGMGMLPLDSEGGAFVPAIERILGRRLQQTEQARVVDAEADWHSRLTPMPIGPFRGNTGIVPPGLLERLRMLQLLQQRFPGLKLSDLIQGQTRAVGEPSPSGTPSGRIAKDNSYLDYDIADAPSQFSTGSPETADLFSGLGDGGFDWSSLGSGIVNFGAQAVNVWTQIQNQKAAAEQARLLAQTEIEKARANAAVASANAQVTAFQAQQRVVDERAGGSIPKPLIYGAVALALVGGVLLLRKKQPAAVMA